MEQNSFQTWLRWVYKQSPFLRLMINIQGCHQTINIVAGDKGTFLLKKWARRVWRERNADTFTLSSRRFHCCSLDANSSRSLTRSFSSLCVILCGSVAITLCANYDHLLLMAQIYHKFCHLLIPLPVYLFLEVPERDALHRKVLAA
jgi:hypothetical protein